MIGSPLRLGQWKVEGALKLSYAGESVWLAESVMRKDEFPIKYPLRVSCSHEEVICSLHLTTRTRVCFHVRICMNDCVV